MVVINAKSAFKKKKGSGPGGSSETQDGGPERTVTPIRVKPARWGMSLVEALTLGIEKPHPNSAQAKELAEAKGRLRARRLRHERLGLNGPANNEDDDPDVA